MLTLLISVNLRIFIIVEELLHLAQQDKFILHVSLNIFGVTF